MSSVDKNATESIRIHSMLSREREFWNLGGGNIAGVDEAGRGPLAGPVVAAAVIFNPDIQLFGVKDSKKLSAKRRDMLFDQIQEKVQAVGVGICDEKEIDRLNILQASYEAMKRAIENLNVPVHHVLVDGFKIPHFSIPQTAIIKGDQLCYSIAAASIIAKVTRDRMMMDYDIQYPQYGFQAHKGYPTKKHVQAIRTYGLCPIHRKSFHVKKSKYYE